MAGIGFELYRILHQGTLGSIFKVFFLGTVIVAGPWILSVLSIFIIQKYAVEAISENPVLFNVTIVFIYAFSLTLFGGVHYIFSRYIADMLYIEDRASIPTALFTIFLIVAFLSIIIAATFLCFNDFSGLRHPGLYKKTFILLFATVNIIWIMLVYVSLLKEYNMIFISYFAGVAASIGGVSSLGERYGVAGALLGYTAGQMFIILLLLIVSLRLYPVKKITINRDLITYFRKYKYLFGIGLFFNIAIWADKIVYWFVKGANIEGTMYYYYVDYDIPVFLAFISMIPGLVYFLVVTEPIFHTAYFKFVKNILTDTHSAIVANKQSMIFNLKKGLTKLVVFQGVWTTGLIMNSEQILSSMGYKSVNPAIMNTLLIAVFFHLLCLTLQTYMLYLELRKEAVLSSLIYMGFNILLTTALISGGVDAPGLSYLISAVASTAVSARYISTRAPIIDFLIFNRTG